MSKMPAWSRSLQSVSLKTLSSAAVSGEVALKSGTARRTRSTPRPVPVRIQSCWGAAANRAMAGTTRASAARRYTKVPRRNTKGRACERDVACNVSAKSLAPVIKIKLHRNFVAAVIGRQGAERVNALERVDSGIVERGHVARLLDLHVRGTSAAVNVERQIDAGGVVRFRAYLVFEPVLRDDAADFVYVPGVACAKVAGAAGHAQATGAAAHAEAQRVGRAALAEGHLVRGLGRGLRARVAGGHLLLGLLLGFALGNRDCLRRLLDLFG